MTHAALFVCTLVLAALVTMARGWLAPELALGLVLALCVVSGTIDTATLLHGFASESLHTVALLLIVSAAVARSGALAQLPRGKLTSTRSSTGVTAGMVFPTMFVSAFLNNTAVVALLLPVVRDLATRVRVAPSKLLIPLSYAAILGGVCTLIGTSTNLVVLGALPDNLAPRFGMFDISRVGIPVAIAGGITLLFISRWLPDRPRPDHLFADPRSFASEFVVEAGGPAVGKRLDRLAADPNVGGYPVEIWRGGVVIAAPQKHEVLRADDRVVFAGPARAALALRRVPGLRAAQNPAYGRTGDPTRRFVEVIVTSRCPLVGQAIGDGSFRARYDAAVVGMVRQGRPLASHRIPDWIVEVGDILLVESAERHEDALEQNGELIVVAGHTSDDPPAGGWSRLLAVLTCFAMIGVAAADIVSMFVAALTAVVLLLLGRVLTWSQALEGIDARLLLTIAFALGIGRALEQTGAATQLSDAIIGLGLDDPWWMLVVLYVVTALVTEVITNNAAAVIMIPLALAGASTLDVDPMAMVMSVTVAASTSFLTPIGYQTNLMVYGPGGYRFNDFLRAGIPMNLVVGLVTILLAPRLWPF